MGKERLRLRILGAAVALATLGLAGIAPAQNDPGDCNGDGLVNDDDLSLMLPEFEPPPSVWHPIPPVEDDDLSLLLANWTGPIYVAHAPPQDTTEFVRVTSVEIDATPYHVWEMRVTTETDWTNTRLDLTLTEGSMYQHPWAWGSEPPLEPLVKILPELAYDTYIQAPDEWPPSPVDDAVMTDKTIGISWFDTPKTDAGTHKIAQITLSADAAGRATGKTYEVATSGVGVAFAFTIVDGTSPLPGDADLSGCVDDDDLSIVLANWAAEDATWASGEFDGDGCVEDDDLCLVLANWTGPCQTIDLVPEPTALTLPALAALVLSRSALRRSDR